MRSRQVRGAGAVAAWRRLAPLLAGCVLFSACAPSLNWREVPLGRLLAWLPCKPDTASRQVSLGAQTLAMDMAGCEVDGTLFAISRIQADDALQAPALMASLRQASLAKLQNPVVHAQVNSGDARTSFDVLVDAQRSDGRPLQARLKWLLAGPEVYQLAVYGERLGSEQTDSLIGQARIR